MYCGNNANNPSLTNGTKVLGTRYKCLQKGKRFGYAQPVDPNFLVPYQPIDTTRKYCGNSSVLPDEYDRFGNLYECYLTGVGVGKKLKADNQPINQNPPPPQFSFGKTSINTFYSTYYVYSLVFIINFFILYYTKPKIILDNTNDTNDTNDNNKINWIKFIFLYLFLSSIFCLLFKLSYNYIYKSIK